MRDMNNNNIHKYNKKHVGVLQRYITEYDTHNSLLAQKLKRLNILCIQFLCM